MKTQLRHSDHRQNSVWDTFVVLSSMATIGTIVLYLIIVR